MSRLENTTKNFMWSTISSTLSAVLGFISRTAFINILGATYLGVNGLFTNVLSLLSFTELGIGTAINFSLYKPLAMGDNETVKALMLFYKKAYRIIALVIFGLGLAIIPFLDLIIKGGEGIKHIVFIYIVFLMNTVISYLFSYKVTLLAADQKSYLMTNVNMIISVITLIIQLIVLYVCRNYFAYLISGFVINTVQWFFINKYIYHLYPYLLDKNVQKLAPTEKKTITQNVKAMMFHKVGELCINQTDNIIISSMVSVLAVGLYNNYYMIISIINKYAVSIFGSASASLGNLVATETDEKKYEVFKGYNFLGFIIFSWTSICLYVLLNPFVEIWLGEEYLIDNLTLFLVIFNYYLVGMRVPIGNIKMAAGLYMQDQFAPILQSIINLIVSIVGAHYWGLAGVFLGTVVSSIAIPCWYRPFVVYKYCFHKPVKNYFIKYRQYLLVLLLDYFATVSLITVMGLIIKSNIIHFLISCLICLVIPNLINYLLFRNSSEFKYLESLVNTIMRKLRWKKD